MVMMMDEMEGRLLQPGSNKKIFVTIKSLSQQIFVSINLCFNKFFVLFVMFSGGSSAWGRKIPK